MIKELADLSRRVSSIERQFTMTGRAKAGGPTSLAELVHLPMDGAFYQLATVSYEVVNDVLINNYLGTPQRTDQLPVDWIYVELGVTVSRNGQQVATPGSGEAYVNRSRVFSRNSTLPGPPIQSAFGTVRSQFFSVLRLSDGAATIEKPLVKGLHTFTVSARVVTSAATSAVIEDVLPFVEVITL